MDSKKKKELELWAAKIRKTALQTIQTAGSGHIGGSFSICDIMSVLYFDKMNVDPANPDKPDRDRLVLSKGHCSPAMYATLALKGFFPVEHLSTFRKLVAHTIKGKGVSLFENNVDFHGGQPKPEQWPACFAELDARLAELED